MDGFEKEKISFVTFWKKAWCIYISPRSLSQLQIWLVNVKLWYARKPNYARFSWYHSLLDALSSNARENVCWFINNNGTGGLHGYILWRNLHIMPQWYSYPNIMNSLSAVRKFCSQIYKYATYLSLDVNLFSTTLSRRNLFDKISTVWNDAKQRESYWISTRGICGLISAT